MNYYERIQEAVNFIEENLLKELYLEEIARHVYMSESNFCRLFFAVTGFSVKEYVRLRRIDCAAREVRQDLMRVLDIAVKYSYNSADAFSRAFRNASGYLPSAYRMQQKEFSFERLDIMKKYFEVQDQKQLKEYPDIKVLKRLAPMRVAYYSYYGLEPERHAFAVLKAWIDKAGIDLKEPSYRIFGYNNPDPQTLDQKEYGYEVCITIDDLLSTQDELVKTKLLEGGLFAVTTIKRGDDLGTEIIGGWQRFTRWLIGSKYRYGNRQYLEEAMGFNEDGSHIGDMDLYMPIELK